MDLSLFSSIILASKIKNLSTKEKYARLFSSFSRWAHATQYYLQAPAAWTPINASQETLLSEIAKKEYQSLVERLIFLINCTRFDVAFATMQAARRMSSPPTKIDSANNAKRILRCLKKKPAPEITYNKRDRIFQLIICYSDASYILH